MFGALILLMQSLSSLEWRPGTTLLKEVPKKKKKHSKKILKMEKSVNYFLILLVLLQFLFSGQAHTPDDKAKGYNMRIDPPRRSANRYTPSVFKKAAKKCKNFVKDVKWSMRK